MSSVVVFQHEDVVVEWHKSGIDTPSYYTVRDTYGFKRYRTREAALGAATRKIREAKKVKSK